MHRPQHGAVAKAPPQLGDGPIKSALVHLPQRLRAEARGHGAALVRDGGVVRREVGVRAARIHHAHAVAAAAKVEVHARGGAAIGEVQLLHAAEGDGRLVEQPAGLAEVFVLRSPAALRPFQRGERAALRRKALAEHGQQQLEGRGGGKPAARRYVGGHIGVKAARSVPGGHAAQQRGARCALRGHGRAGRQADLGAGEALRADAHAPQAVGHGAGEHVRAGGGAEHAPALVVGVVAAELHAPGGNSEHGGRVRGVAKFVHAAAHTAQNALPPRAARAVRARDDIGKCDHGASPQGQYIVNPLIMQPRLRLEADALRAGLRQASRNLSQKTRRALALRCLFYAT